MAYTNIDDPSAYFQTKTGVGASSPQSHTFDGNSDLQPDFLWWKRRDSSGNHTLHDSSRGANKFLYANGTNAEGTDGNLITSFDTNGWSTGSSWFDLGSQTWVTWAWKANGGTTSSNTDGSVTSTVQANQDAGFSIVTFTSAASSGTGIFSVGHGLGQIPAMVITKSRDSTSNWWSWHKGLTGGNSNTSYIVALERITAEGSYSNAWGAGMTSSVFGMQSGNTAVASSDYVAYCFAEKQGFSQFGNYTGWGNTNGMFIYTSFKPAFVILKRIDGNAGWYMWDTKRETFNPNNQYLNTVEADAEQSSSTFDIDFLSNGLKLRNTNAGLNGTGGRYIYMAFAENPFVTSTGIPTTAR